MSSESTTELVDRLIARIAELEHQLSLDAKGAAARWEQQKGNVRQALLRALPPPIGGPDAELGDEACELRRQLEELELQMALARMDTEEAFLEQRKAVMHSLAALEGAIRSYESAANAEGEVHYRNFVREARRLEDQMNALQVHFALGKATAAEGLADARDDLRKRLAGIRAQLMSADGIVAKDMKSIGKSIREEAGILWDHLKEFMTYIETEDEKQRRDSAD